MVMTSTLAAGAGAGAATAGTTAGIAGTTAAINAVAAAGTAAAGTAATAGSALATAGSMYTAYAGGTAATSAITASSLIEAATMGAMALSSGVGIMSSMRQGQMQKQQAEQQKEIAEANRDAASEQASALRRQAYDASVKKRQEASMLIGKQRAIAGASGAAVDVGSNLDIQIDTAERGAADATNIYNKGMDQAYNAEMQAWNYGQQANAYSYTASNAENTSWLNAAATGLGGIASVGSTWMKFKTNPTRSGY